jgi:hypothetical protein
MHVQGKELIEAHGGLRCFRLASGAVAVNSALEEADGVEGRINALLFAERIPFEWRRATPQIGRRSQRPWLGRGEDANGHLKSRDDAISIMIHGLQGAAKLVNNVGRDSTSSAYCEVSDDEVTKESSTSRFRHPNQVISAFASCPLSRVRGCRSWCRRRSATPTREASFVSFQLTLSQVLSYGVNKHVPV